MTTIKDTGASKAEGGAPRIRVEAVRARATALVNSVFDFGALWADTGLGFVRTNIESGARALERTAKLVETYQERIKRAETKPAA